MVKPSSSNEPTAAQHLAWCKKRALVYVKANQPTAALSSFLSDLRKHPETDRVLPSDVMAIGFGHVMRGETENLRGWIEAFWIS